MRKMDIEIVNNALSTENEIIKNALLPCDEIVHTSTLSYTKDKQHPLHSLTLWVKWMVLLSNLCQLGVKSRSERISKKLTFALVLVILLNWMMAHGSPVEQVKYWLVSESFELKQLYCQQKLDSTCAVLLPTMPCVERFSCHPVPNENNTCVAVMMEDREVDAGEC